MQYSFNSSVMYKQQIGYEAEDGHELVLFYFFSIKSLTTS